MTLIAVDITKHFEQMLGQASPAPVLVEPVTGWCMVLVRPGYEQECRDSLRRHGVGTWWPNFGREVGAKDRASGKRYKRMIRVSVLPCVLLCPARLTSQFWRALDLAPGAQNVARKFNSEIVLLSDIDIVLIHKIEVGLNRQDAPPAGHSLQVGDIVRFVDDDLRRLPSGEVTECSRDGHIQIDVNMFGRMTKWTVAAWQVESVGGRNENQLRRKATDARERPAKSPSGRKAG